MKSTSIKEYLRHYGSIRSLRGSVIRSTFKRVTAAFDDFDSSQVEAAMRELALNPEDLTCVYCGLAADCWDHLVPAARGGTHQIRNLAPACTSCNNKKGHKAWSGYFATLSKTLETKRREKLVHAYAEPYIRGESLITDPSDQMKLDELLLRIHQAMSEADEIVQAAIHRKSLTARGDA